MSYNEGHNWHQLCPFFMSETMSQIQFSSPIGQITISVDDNTVQSITLFAEEIDSDHSSPTISALAIRQLQHYFHQAHNQWSLPLATKGTLFQKQVWQYLQTIPMGQTRTYSEVAKALNSSARAVGNACRSNPFSIVVPCHRVVSKTGLGGYSGKTEGNELTVKQWLLNHEKN